MSKNSDFCEYVLDLLSPFGHAKARKMFGGYGVYLDGLIICIIADDELYFKADKHSLAKYKNAGGEQFVYYKHDKPFYMNYFKFSADVLEDTAQLKKWVESSYKISSLATSKQP